MKKLIYVVLPIILITVSCEKFLDQQPISDLSSELFWRTPDDAQLGIAGVYDGLQSAIGTGNFTDWGDARSDNFTFGGTGENQITITLNGLNSTTSAADWGDLYVTIGRANSAVKYINRTEGLTAAAKNNYLSQALAIRAYMYFYAVRVWGDIPVRLEPYESLTDIANVTRTPAQTVIDDIIIPDLLEAYELSDKTNNTVWEVNPGGILAILTDVYMWTKNYPKVLETTQKIAGLNRYGLVPSSDWKKVFIDPGTTSIKENIWSLHWSFSQDRQGNGVNNFAKIGSGSNTSNYKIDSVVFNRFEAHPEDIRRTITYDTLLKAGTQGVNQIWKFYPAGPDGKITLPVSDQNEAKIPLYRYADILLLRAEALNRSNDKPGAIGIVNQIRTRAGLSALNVADYINATDKEVETVILEERQMELFAEGRRWFDLVRTDRVLEVMDPIIRHRQELLSLTPVGFTDERKILFPISREALNRNPLLVQNEPYSE